VLSPYVSQWHLDHRAYQIKSHQPTCHINHLPPYLAKYNEFKEKGVDVIAVIAANDPFVMSGWGRVEGLADKASQ
jgi:peroxiredoxin